MVLVTSTFNWILFYWLGQWRSSVEKHTVVNMVNFPFTHIIDDNLKMYATLNEGGVHVPTLKLQIVTMNDSQEGVLGVTLLEPTAESDVLCDDRRHRNR